jgi:hypothetical protein
VKPSSCGQAHCALTTQFGKTHWKKRAKYTPSKGLKKNHVCYENNTNHTLILYCLLLNNLNIFYIKQVNIVMDN